MKKTIKSIPAVLAMIGTSAMCADFTPIPLTTDSYNQDMVVEKDAPAAIAPDDYTTASMDGGAGNTGDTWNERGLFESDTMVGLPPAGTTISTNNHQFTFAASYLKNNAIMLDVDHFTNANWTLTTPGAYTALSFLTSGGNGGCVFKYTAQRQDGTTESGQLASPDWFNATVGLTWVANGRVNAQSLALDNYDSANPRLYAVDATLSGSSSPITNLAIQYVSGNASGHTCIMAISGATTSGGAYTPILGTGYNADIVVEATAVAPVALSSGSTATMDAGTANTGTTWFEQGYYVKNATYGLPAAATTITGEGAPDHRFTMPASYTENNAVYLDPNATTATITLATPAAYTALAFLTAAGNGPGVIQAVVNHQNSATETHILNSPDWFNNSPIIWTANGRVSIDGGTLAYLGSGNPRLYSVDMLLDENTSPVASIDLTYTSTSGRAAIFALSGATGAILPVITNQPGNLTIKEGATALFTVGVQGTGYGCQWQSASGTNFANLSDGGSISGAQTTSLQLSKVSLTNSGLNYRVVVTNAVGSVTSSVAVLTISSTAANLATPTDGIAIYNGSTPDAETVDHAIDGLTSKYLNYGFNGANTPFVGPAGLLWTPSVGRTIVTGLRIFTANDATERDPANYVLEGSTDGGAHFTLISSNLLTLPVGRNEPALDIDPSTQYFGEASFANTTAFTYYRLSFTKVRDNASSLAVQFAEVQFLGTVSTSPTPYFTLHPQSATVLNHSSATFTAAASGAPEPKLQWAKGTGGLYTLLTDGGNLSGATSGTLTLDPATYSDVTDYVCIASNAYGMATSAVATLSIISTMTNVVQAGCVITTFGDESVTAWDTATNAVNAVDGNYTKYVNGGSGFSAGAGFPPFAGPVGLVITPQVDETTTPATTNASQVVGLRIYTADANPERDPADYTLEGSNDGGVTFVPIASGALSLPTARNASAEVPVDPLTGIFQDVFFNHGNTFTTYRVTFAHTRNDSTAACLQFAEIQFLGTTGGFSPSLSWSAAGGKLTITTSLPATLYSTTNVVAGPWVSEGAISGSITITPSASAPAKFYRVGAAQ
jgi:hypothetical protein